MVKEDRKKKEQNSTSEAIAAREALKKHIDETGTTQAGAAKSMGMRNQTAVSQFINGYYPGDVPGMIARINTYIKRAQKQHVETSRKVVIETSAYRKASQLYNRAQAKGGLFLAVGEAGVGKTVAWKLLDAEHQEMVLIEVPPSASTTYLFHVLAKAVGYTFTSSSLNFKLEELAAHLKGLPGLVIVIDEGENLGKLALEYLRRLTDFTEVAIILSGTYLLQDELCGRKSTHKQLYSRIKTTVHFQKVSESEVAALCEAFGLGMSLAEKVMGKIGAHIRDITNYLDILADVQDRHGTITNEMFNKASQLLTV